MLVDDSFNSGIWNLLGDAVNQLELAEAINQAYGTHLGFTSLSVNTYNNLRKSELGDFLGTIIGSIYESIRNGAFEIESDFETLVGRPHKSLTEMIQAYRESASE